MTDDLKALSDAATSGEWTVLGSGRDCRVDEWNYGYDGEVPQADIEYTCRLSNDYRAGELVEAGKLRELVKEWRIAEAEYRSLAAEYYEKDDMASQCASSGYTELARGFGTCAGNLAALIGAGE